MTAASACRSLALALALATPAVAADTGTTTAAAPETADLTPARAAIDTGDYANALKLLAPIVKAEPKNADAWNLMGYSSRHLKHYVEAARYYDIALRADPKHVGALEYQGELYVETGDYAKAKQNLKMLQSLCGTCDQALDLQAALQAKGQS